MAGSVIFLKAGQAQTLTGGGTSDDSPLATHARCHRASGHRTPRVGLDNEKPPAEPPPCGAARPTRAPT